MRLVVAFTANDRPEYLKEVLESWREVDGIEGVTMLFNVEPGNQEVWKLCTSVDFTEAFAYPNPARYGAHGNPYMALRRAFNWHADFAILAEDDSVVSNDVLDYFATMAEGYKGDESIFTVCACNLRCGICCERPDHVRRGAFCSTVWGLWRHRWEEVAASWSFGYDDHGGWDMKFTSVVKGARDCLIPCVSRAQHIGKYGGTHMQPDDFEQMRSSCFEPRPGRATEWGVMPKVEVL